MSPISLLRLCRGMPLTLVLIGCFSGMVLAVASGADYYVSPAGDDAWSGRSAEPNEDGTDGPWRTLAHACASVGPGDTCRLREGVYREVLKPAGSGTAAAPILFTAEAGETVVLSGADAVKNWEPAGDGLFRAPLDWDLEDENQVFAGKAMLTEARWPNLQGTLLTPARAQVAAGAANTISDPSLHGGDDFWKGATLWCAGGKRWYCWSAKVTAFDATTKTLTFDKPQPDKWYMPRQGNDYVLMGIRNALDTEGEWWFDHGKKTLWLRPRDGQNPNRLEIAAKRRRYAIDLSGRSHIHVSGIDFRAGGILTDAHSHHLLLKDLTGRYIGHSYLKDVSTTSTVLIAGHHIELNSCELAYASGSLVRMEGHDNRLVNCYLHDGNYAGKWKGTASFSGRRQLISHNTICNSGRDVCSVHGLMQSVIQYNDLSHAGRLTSDLGMTYGHDTDFMGTVIRYNWVHDNVAQGHTAGIYFDHCSHNAIVHHNVVWNVPGVPLQINNPAYFMLCYNNTFWNTGRISTFDHSHRNDLFGSRFQNNISAGPIRLPQHVVTEPNLIDENPGLIAPENRRFGLEPDSPARNAGVPLLGVAERSNGKPPDLGAVPPHWKAGHDFAHPPSVDLDIPPIAFSNLIHNAAFELGTTESWTITGSGAARIVSGNGWGNNYGRGEAQNTGTSKHELKLQGPVRVTQRIENLSPETHYRLSGWLKVTDKGSPARLGVTGHGGPEIAASCTSDKWERKIVEFTTANDVTKITVFIQLAADSAEAFADNLGFPRTPKGS